MPVDDLCSFLINGEMDHALQNDVNWNVFAYIKHGIRGVAIVSNVLVNELFERNCNLRLGMFRLYYRSNDMSDFCPEEKRNNAVICLEYNDCKKISDSVCWAVLRDFIEHADDVASDPVAWYEAWGRTVGNTFSEIDPYSVIAELLLLKKCIETGKISENNLDAWSGPDGNLHDFELENCSVEVKSTTVRTKRQITISSPYQLEKTDGKPLWLAFFEFELNPNGAYSIKSVIESLPERMQNEIREKIDINDGIGWENKKYNLIEEKFFEVNEHFPRLSIDQNGLPPGIVDYTYTVSLENLLSFRWEDVVERL